MERVHFNGVEDLPLRGFATLSIETSQWSKTPT